MDISDRYPAGCVIGRDCPVRGQRTRDEFPHQKGKRKTVCREEKVLAKEIINTHPKNSLWLKERRIVAKKIPTQRRAKKPDASSSRRS